MNLVCIIFSLIGFWYPTPLLFIWKLHFDLETFISWKLIPFYFNGFIMNWCMLQLKLVYSCTKPGLTCSSLGTENILLPYTYNCETLMYSLYYITICNLSDNDIMCVLFLKRKKNGSVDQILEKIQKSNTWCCNLYHCLTVDAT